MRSFKVTFNPDRHVTLRAFLFSPPSGDEVPTSLEHPRPALIICPGGGYEFLSEREADPVAAAFMRHGFNAFILNYSIREHSAHPAPTVDAARAVRWVRRNAEELGIDPRQVTLMGFSAGGHVTAMLGTHFDDADVLEAERREYASLAVRGLESNEGLLEHSSRPDAIVPCYAVFNNDWTERPGIPGETMRQDTIGAVTDRTPPAFVWTTGEDETVPATQSLRFVNALSAAGVPFEYHHFTRGPHGLSTADRLSNMDRAELPENAHAWVDLCANWLRHNSSGD